MKKPFYLTTTLPYVNAPLHVGHALEFVRADAVVRWNMLLGNEVFFNTGTDEHGLKIFQKAQELGEDVQDFVNEGFVTFQKQVESFGVTKHIHYVRTTDAHHIAAAQEFWKRVQDRGYIYKKNYQAKYCVSCELERTDSELVNGECPEHPGQPLEVINEENYFFKFSALQKDIEALFEKRPDFVIPEFRFNEMKAFVSRGLKDFSISRLKDKMPWGIPVPGDEDQVMYVWFDALTNYITTLGWPEDQDTFIKFWAEGTPTQYCGKDNTRFQSVMWQSMLIAAGLPNSYQIVVNGHITAEGGTKMSKSLGNVVNPLDIVEQYGTDALRLFLLKEISSYEDSPFTMDRFLQSYNAHLANGIGNLTSRILTLSEKHCEPLADFSEPAVPDAVMEAMKVYDIQSAVQHLWSRISELDARIANERPFSVIKEDEAKGKELIAKLVRDLYEIARLLTPFLPDTSHRIIELIKANKKPEAPLFARI